MFGAIDIVQNSDKCKYLYSGHGIEFDGAGSWSFGNNFARNAVTFSIDNSSLSHVDHLKNIFLVLGEGSTDDINGSADR